MAAMAVPGTYLIKFLPHLALPLAACSTVIPLAQELKKITAHTITNESMEIFIETIVYWLNRKFKFWVEVLSDGIIFKIVCNNYTKRAKNKKMQKPVKIFAFKYYNLSSFI